MKKSVQQKSTAGHKLIPTGCQVALDYRLSIACQTFLGSLGFLGRFEPQSEDKNTLGREQLYIWPREYLI